MSREGYRTGERAELACDEVTAKLQSIPQETGVGIALQGCPTLRQERWFSVPLERGQNLGLLSSP